MNLCIRSTIDPYFPVTCSWTIPFLNFKVAWQFEFFFKQSSFWIPRKFCFWQTTVKFSMVLKTGFHLGYTRSHQIDLIKACIYFHFSGTWAISINRARQRQTEDGTWHEQKATRGFTSRWHLRRQHHDQPWEINSLANEEPNFI
jgi:hypothetical protein